jgi:predicted dehydrogenase
VPAGLARAAEAVPGRKLRVALVGIGNQGNNLLKSFAATGLVEFAAFCDADLMGEHTLESRQLYPDVPAFQDFREMFDRVGDRFEAVIVATPDHSHFVVCMHALDAGKHVYVEKPIAHTFREVELLMAKARETGLVTQMGNQGHSGNNFFQFKAWTEAGIIRDVTKIVLHMNSPRRWHGWQIKGFEKEPVPETIDWDVWNANKAVRPFSQKLHPGNWRSWFDYGSGAFGDWGPHLLDTAHRFLELGLPTAIEAERLDGANKWIFPQASTIRFDFPARRHHPACQVYWYDGLENIPALPEGMGPDARFVKKNGKIIISKEHIFQGGSHGDTLRIAPESKMQEMARSLPRITTRNSDHYENFVLACWGREEARSDFAVSGPLTQVFLLGVIAQRRGGKLRFDPARKRFVRNFGANRLLDGPKPRRGWEKYYAA